MVYRAFLLRLKMKKISRTRGPRHRREDKSLDRQKRRIQVLLLHEMSVLFDIKKKKKTTHAESRLT